MRIIQYIGEKISSPERAVRLAAGNAYIFHLTYRYAIDGQTLANTARYINHSCDPNCAVEKTSDTIWIIALREITAGEEPTTMAMMPGIIMRIRATVALRAAVGISWLKSIGV